MTALAPTVEAFFTQRLAVQRDASPHTVAAYRDTLRLLVVFAHITPAHRPPGSTSATSTPRWSRRSSHLETERHNSVSTRNTRLTAIHTRYSATPPCSILSTPNRSSGCWPSPPNATSRNWCAS